MNTIQQVARQAADDAVVNNCNLGDVPAVIRREVADAVAVAVLRSVQARCDERMGYPGVPSMIFAHEFDTLLAAFTPAEPPQQETTERDTCGCGHIRALHATGPCIGRKVERGSEVLSVPGIPAYTPDDSRPCRCSGFWTWQERHQPVAPAEPTQQETKVLRAPTTEAETVADPRGQDRE